MSSDACHITQPSADGAARAMRAALCDAKLGPEQIEALMEAGVDTDRMYQLLYQNERAERVALQARAMQSLTLDCDTLTVQCSDLHIMIFTAEPGTEDAERLALLTVLGTQTLVG